MSCAFAIGSGRGDGGEDESASGGREVVRAGRGDGTIIEPWGEMWDAKEPVEAKEPVDEGDRLDDLGL